MPVSNGPGSGGKGSAGDAGDRGNADDAGAGVESDAAPNVSNGSDGGTADGPTIEILAPKAAGDPNADTILTTSTIVVRCKVTRSHGRLARDVNQSSVRMRASAGSMMVEGVVQAQPDDIFEAEFNLADYPNGPLAFECAADDIGMPPSTGSATLDTFLDLGPEIRIVEPTDKGVYALTNKVTIKFEVKPSKVTGADKEATPKDIKLDVSGQSFKFTQASGQPGLFTTAINFSDKKLFAMAPATAEITVSASSSRTPKAPQRKAKVDITLDAEGPSIAVSSPANFSIVRGEVALNISISDPSGVKNDSVIATINQNLFTLNDWTISGGNFSERFDTRSFGNELTQLTINIKASDQVGNQSTVDHVLRLDNVPPLISLDPPALRLGNKHDPMHFFCSDAFDPVGADAISDLGTADVSSMYRVMIWEETNHSPGANIDYVAGVKDSTVKLYAQVDPSIPLLIDTSGDGKCDEINSDALPQDQRPVQISLSPLSVKGSAYYSTMPDLSNPAHMAPAGCEAGTETMPHASICPATAMFCVTAQPIEGGPPAIYAIAPTNGSTGACEGNTWELLPIVGEGWACLAARVEDNIGNVGVSPPIRVCFDDGSGPPACNPGSDTPPNCADNCTWPPEFSPNSMLISY